MEEKRGKGGQEHTEKKTERRQKKSPNTKNEKEEREKIGITPNQFFNQKERTETSHHLRLTVNYMLQNIEQKKEHKTSIKTCSKNKNVKTAQQKHVKPLQPFSKIYTHKPNISIFTTAALLSRPFPTKKTIDQQPLTNSQTTTQQNTRQSQFKIDICLEPPCVHSDIWKVLHLSMIHDPSRTGQTPNTRIF
jgi:hypothetical protein